MSLRPATPADAQALAAVHIASWRVAYRGLVPDSTLAGLDVDRRAQRFREALAAGSEETSLLEEQGTVLGFVTLGNCRDQDLDAQVTGEIWGIYLAPEHWRQGLGRSLCRQAEQILRSRGYTQVALWVFEGNDNARRFYEAMGFQADGASKTLNPGAPLKAIRYRKSL
jgi:ribosomal protein S18 acetylase RimI-like enzyme